MQLYQATISILDQVEFVIKQIKNNDYTKPLDVFNGSTLGQHFRHTLEFFQMLEDGYEKGIISYDKRAHNKSIENNKNLALDSINTAKAFVGSCDMKRPISLEVNYNLESCDDIVVDSNLAREITYNIEHAIHHMAIIKIGLRVACPYIDLPHGFGVAISTLRYHDVVNG